MYPGIFPGACRKGEVIYDRLHYCRNHYDGCDFCFCDNGNDEGSFYIRRSYREVYGECEGEEWWFTKKRKRTVTLNVRNVKKYSVQKNMTWLHTSIETSWVEGIYISAVTTA